MKVIIQIQIYMMYRSTFFSFFLFVLQSHLILAQDKPCAGHDVKVEYFRNCAEPKVHNIQIKNLQVTVTDDCKIIPRGCFKVKKSISNAKVDYVVSKPPFKKRGSEDLCKMLESPEAKKTFENYKNIPKKCTIPAGEHCVKQGSTTVEQLGPKTLNLLTGTSTGTFNVESDGAQACAEFKLVVSRKS